MQQMSAMVEVRPDTCTMASDERAAGYETAFEALAGTYLEDSWVLDASDAGLVVTFELDLVLTPEHRQCRPPAPSDQHSTPPRT